MAHDCDEVYIIRHNGFYKIGICRGLERRMRCVLGVYNESDVIYHVKTKIANMVESFLHERFKCNRVHLLDRSRSGWSEWFAFSPDEITHVIYIADLYQNDKKGAIKEAVEYMETAYLREHPEKNGHNEIEYW